MFTHEQVRARIEVESESPELDFKSLFDPCQAGDWCELIKDFVAMSNSGGGIIVFGINDDGTPSSSELSKISELDPASISDKLKRYVNQDISAFYLLSCERAGQNVVCLAIGSASIPIVFTTPGTYDVGNGKQKTAFSKGTIYFRHGAKSEPGTSDDLRLALQRELDRVRSSWLDGIQKVIAAPIGATLRLVSSNETGESDLVKTEFRLVDEESATPMHVPNFDDLYPLRRKDVVRWVNRKLGIIAISPHDVHCIRKSHDLDANRKFCCRLKHAAPQYSHQFVEWIVDQLKSDPDFAKTARESFRTSTTKAIADSAQQKL